MLKSHVFSRETEVFYETEPVDSIYILSKGAAGYILPFDQKIVFIEVDQGEDFGLGDIIELSIKNNIDVEEVVTGHGTAQRSFTVYALTNCELLALTLEILSKMCREFKEEFQKLFAKSEMKLKRLRLQQLRAIKACQKEKNIVEYGDITEEKFVNHFASTQKTKGPN